MYVLLLSLLLTLSQCCPDRCSCYDDLLNGGYITNCSDAGLYKPPHDIDIQTTLLDLSRNRIQDTSWQQWVSQLQLRNISKIIVTDNILTTLPEPPSPHIILDASSNPFYCDCNTILRLRDLRPQLVSVREMRCMSPPLDTVLNKPIEQLNTADLSCVNTDLELPAEITIYRVREQVIPCRKAEDFTGEVIWKKRDIVIYRTTQQDCSLTIRDVTSYNAGLYVINVVNTFEKRTYTLNVNIKASYAPTISVTSSSIIVVPKLGTARVTCNVTGSPPPKVTWSPADNAGISLDDPSIMLDGPTLVLTEVEREMVFVCTASNQMGVTRSTFIVKNESRRNTSHLFSMLALIALTIMVILVFLSVIYIVYSRQKLARLKDRCSSAASNNSGITYENSDAMSSITQCDGFKIITISPSSPPHQLICPITREWMKFPVVAGDGFSYEESAIRSWFKHNNTSPMTNGEISKLLIKNHNLRTLARDLIEQTPVPRSTSITQDLERGRNKSDNRRTRENSEARRANSDIQRSHSAVNGEVQSSIDRAAVERSDIERAATEIITPPQNSLRTVVLETNLDDGARTMAS